VTRRLISAYDLTPEQLGKFDVVVCGSLLLHLRDPVRALEAIRSVCDGSFMSVEQVSLSLTLLFRKRALAELRSGDERCQWWVANTAGHRRLVETAGFEVVQRTSPFLEAFGAGHPGVRGFASVRHPPALARRLVLGGRGIPHAALLARPALARSPDA
jgi:tRNA (mo5U34)-methyltransferase